MTGAGAVSSTTLTIGLAHALALIEVSLPATATAVTLKAGTTTVTPCKIGAGYRYIAKPQTGVTLSGGYSYLGETMAWEKIGVTLTAGKYTKIDVKSPIISKTINGIEAVAIPKGTFMMGSPSGEAGRYSNETQHQVTLTQDFYMSRYEITNAQYAAFLNANGIGSNGQGNLTSDGSQTYIFDCTQNSRSQWGVRWNVDKWEPASGKENFPVVYVRWYGAKAFAGWIGGSLPTEAQWEYACRAGTSTAYSYGASADGGYMWYNVNSGNSTHAVGTTTSGSGNAWGLYDMHGNVGEWCEDSWNGTAAYGTGVVTDPVSPNPGSRRVLRGGGWDYDAQGCRSAYRYYADPVIVYSYIGFRVVFVP
ncbi:hypothetical protein AGMMS50239_22030 [Bacteroidia bacterium]|nr:hypothetical protein AGMMS50239_22030 [Bacteroidia bacterium]